MDVPLLDEIVLIDSNSSDRTRDIAASLGIPVFIHQSVLPKYGARRGKGEALWKSLYCTHGDIIIWIDTDILNIHPHFVYGLIGPLLVKPDIHFVKGFYERPLKLGQETQSRAGGRVTELTAAPICLTFFTPNYRAWYSLSPANMAAGERYWNNCLSSQAMGLRLDC